MQPAATVAVQPLRVSTRLEHKNIDVDEPKVHHPIVEVVRYVPMRPAGRTLAGVAGQIPIVIAVVGRGLLRLYPGRRGSQTT